MKFRSILIAAGLAFNLIAVAQWASAERQLPPRRVAAEPGDRARVIVTYKAQARLVQEQPLAHLSTRGAVQAVAQRRADALSVSARVPLVAGRALSERQQVIKAAGLSSIELVQRLRADPNVERVTIDGRKRALAEPNDPLYFAGPAISGISGGPTSGQWYLKPAAGEVKSSINAPAAWGRGALGAGVVVAVLDTGILADHVDLAGGRILAGYDTIADVDVANDGDARDSDARDPGDWITAAESNTKGGEFYQCTALSDSDPGPYEASDSTWHGTKVAGVLAADTNNLQGIAGVAYGARVLPVRVLGKCGGFDSDIILGMKWAAGIDQPALKGAATPAQIINMSLGSSGDCSADYRAAVAEVMARNVLVVAAAGNSEGHAVGTPADCPGVMAVAGLRHAGTKVGFSDLGPQISIAAPGGNCVNLGLSDPCLYAILTTSNNGGTSPLAGGSIYTDAFRAEVGTSFSAPIVSGVAALVKSARSDLTGAEIKAVIEASANPFPTTGSDATIGTCQAPMGTRQLECYCTTGLCGAGMLDADRAVALALSGRFARLSWSPALPTAGTAIQLDASKSLVGSDRTVVRWVWNLVDGGGVVAGFSSATDGATASLQPTAAGSVTVRVTAIDQLGEAHSLQTVVPVVAAAPSAGGGGSSSGGGWMSPVWLLALLAATALLGIRRQA